MKGEFALIEDFVAAFPRGRGELALGVGDDCAILRPRAGEELLLTTDAVVERVHFTRDFSPEEIGHKALAVNLSDLAAMGARPVAFLCALAFPPQWARALPRIAKGMSKLAKAHRCQLAGGNMSRARELSLTITAIGAAPTGTSLRRSGARVGDRLLVSGALGGAAAGLRSASRPLRIRQRLPEPRIRLGQLARPHAHAAIDISDGLIQDLGHVLELSRVGAELALDRVPVARGATLDDALSGGEDYELLLCVPPGRVPVLQRGARALGLPLTDVGGIVRGRGIRGLEGRRPAGHDHFR